MTCLMFSHGLWRKLSNQKGWLSSFQFFVLMMPSTPERSRCRVHGIAASVVKVLLGRSTLQFTFTAAPKTTPSNMRPSSWIRCIHSIRHASTKHVGAGINPASLLCVKIPLTPDAHTMITRGAIPGGCTNPWTINQKHLPAFTGKCAAYPERGRLHRGGPDFDTIQEQHQHLKDAHGIVFKKAATMQFCELCQEWVPDGIEGPDHIHMEEVTEIIRQAGYSRISGSRQFIPRFCIFCFHDPHVSPLLRTFNTAEKDG